MDYPPTHGLRIAVDANTSVSALLRVSDDAWASYVFAHGAGAGMAHGFITSFADGLAERGIASLRYQFPYMEQGSKRPDVPMVAHAAVRAAVAEGTQRMPSLPLFAGGKSFGGRMTSQAQALSPLPGLRDLVFVGFPLHPAGKQADERAAHLFGIACPMLFLQGTGIGVIDQAVAADGVKSGQLVPVLPEWRLAPVPLHLMTSSRLVPAGVRLFAEFLGKRLPPGSLTDPIFGCLFGPGLARSASRRPKR